MAITLKEIARIAGVSFQAVSAALNDTPGIRVSPEKREMIRKIAAELGYQRNFCYNLMHNKQTNTAAIVVAMPRMAQEEHLRILVLELMNRFNEMQIATYYFDRMTESIEENLNHIRRLISRGVEAFIMIGSPHGHCEIQQEFKSRNCTFICFDAPLLERNLQPDSFEMRRKIIDLIRQKTGENFKLILPSTTRDSSYNRLLKWLYPGSETKTVWNDKVFELPPFSWDINEQFLFECGWQATARLLEKEPHIRGFVFPSDSFALGSGGYLETQGFTVGKDVFVSGFNANNSVKMQKMPIITAELPYKEAVDILIRESYLTQPFAGTIHWELITGNTFFNKMAAK